MFGTPSHSEPGLALPSHTFHGGEEPASATTQDTKWWNDPAAIQRDREAMRRYFPSFTEVPATADSPPSWQGTIDSGRGRFSILLKHRADHGLPSVVPISPTVRLRSAGRRAVKSPHLYMSGNLCVASADDWDADRDSMATVVAWVAHWHACYVEWFAGGQWPTEGFHASAA